MAYDEALADAIRRHLVIIGVEPVERKMFGGLAFLIDGNMALAAMGQGGAIVRVDPETTDNLIANSHATVAQMGDRQMTGWLQVDAEHLATDEELERWVTIGVERARSLPAKH